MGMICEGKIHMLIQFVNGNDPLYRKFCHAMSRLWKPGSKPGNHSHPFENADWREDSFKDITCRIIPAIYHLIQETKRNRVMAGDAGVNKIILSRTMGELYSVSLTYKSLRYISRGSPGNDTSE